MGKISNELDETLRNEYRVHVLEDLDRVEQILLDSESNLLSHEHVRKILLLIHSIKGSSGTYGFNFASSTCHSLEDYLNSEDLVKNKSQIVDTLLNYNDLLKDYFNNSESEQDENLNRFKQRLESLSSIKSTVDYKILIVELSKTLSSACERILRDLGIRVSIVRDGYEALGRLIKEEFDCLITSKSVSTINGIQLIHSLSILDTPNKNILKVLITTDKKSDLNQLNCQTLIKDQELLIKLGEFFKEKIKNIEATDIQTYEQAHGTKSKNLRKILCVDDDKLLQKVIKISLKSIPDIEIECCTSPLESLKMIEDFTPDLLILDVMMEEMSGVELAERIKKTHHNVPFIFLTGKTNQKEIDELKAQGAIAVIGKPFKPKELYQQVLESWSRSQK